MEKAKSHPALEVLLAFFSDMNAWESEAARQHESIDWENADEAQLERDRVLRQQRVERIYEKYCEIGREAERLQDSGVSFRLGKPQHEDETIVRVTERAGKVIVETTEPEERGWEYRYELVNIDGKWRICDNRRYRSKGDKRWSKDLL